MIDRAPTSGGLLAHYAQFHPSEFARAAVRMGGTEVDALLASLPKSALAAVVTRLPRGVAQELLDGSSDSELVQWLSEADLGSAVRLAQRLSQSRRADLADRLPARLGKDLDRYCSFPDGSVGARVDAGFATVSDAQPVADAVHALGSAGAAGRAPLLVVDGEGRLVGVLDARLALLRGPSALVRECMAPAHPLKAGAQLHVAAAEFALCDEPCLPVVDGQSRPIGLLHSDRLPEVSTAQGTGTPPVLATLAATMFELLAELPALAAVERPVP